MLVGSGGITLKWNNYAINDSINVSPVVNTTYFVTVSDSNNCSSLDSVIVNINSLPTVEAGSNDSICVGDNIDLQASGRDTYLWNTSETTNSINVGPLSDTLYYVTVTNNNNNNNNCTGTDSVYVSVNSLPTADAGQDTNTCIGNPIQLTAIGGNSYQWDGSETTSIITVNPSVATTYYVTVSIGSCTDLDSVIVDVVSLPNSIINGITDICEGNTEILSVSDGTEWNWSNGSTGLGTNDSLLVSPLSSTTYYVTVTENNCSSNDSLSVTFTPQPIVSITGDTTVCFGLSITLTATGNTTGYSWNPSNKTTSSITEYPTSTVTYKVTTSNK